MRIKKNGKQTKKYELTNKMVRNRYKTLLLLFYSCINGLMLYFPPQVMIVMFSSPFPWGIILVTTIFNSGYVGILASCDLFVAKLSVHIGFKRDCSEIQQKITKRNFFNRK